MLGEKRGEGGVTCRQALSENKLRSHKVHKIIFLVHSLECDNVVTENSEK